MTTKANHRLIAGTISDRYADKLSALAKSRGLTLHAFVSKVLTTVAHRTPMPDPNAAPRIDPANDPANKLSETLTVELPIPLALRLKSAACQMRDEFGRPWPLATLVRELLIHEYQHPTSVVQQIQDQTDPAYADIVPLSGQLITRMGRDLLLLRIKCTVDTYTAVRNARQQREVTLAKLVRDALDAHLPQLPQ